MDKDNKYNEILRLNLWKSYTPWMSQEKILEKWSQAWKLNEQRAKKISFVIFTYNWEIVWICYIPNPEKNWKKDPKDNTRMVFKEWKMLWGIVSKAQNPVKYIKLK